MPRSENLSTHCTHENDSAPSPGFRGGACRDVAAAPATPLAFRGSPRRRLRGSRRLLSQPPAAPELSASPTHEFATRDLHAIVQWFVTCEESIALRVGCKPLLFVPPCQPRFGKHVSLHERAYATGPPYGPGSRGCDARDALRQTRGSGRDVVNRRPYPLQLWPWFSSADQL